MNRKSSLNPLGDPSGQFLNSGSRAVSQGGAVAGYCYDGQRMIGRLLLGSSRISAGLPGKRGATLGFCSVKRPVRRRTASDDGRCAWRRGGTIDCVSRVRRLRVAQCDRRWRAAIAAIRIGRCRLPSPTARLSTSLRQSEPFQTGSETERRGRISWRMCA